jgi:hypothetical protein
MLACFSDGSRGLSLYRVSIKQYPTIITHYATL